MNGGVWREPRREPRERPVERPVVRETTAFGAAERGQRVERSLVAIDGDDVRTYHLSTSFERESSAAPVAANQISRATREAVAV